MSIKTYSQNYYPYTYWKWEKRDPIYKKGWKKPASLGISCNGAQACQKMHRPFPTMKHCSRITIHTCVHQISWIVLLLLLPGFLSVVLEGPWISSSRSTTYFKSGKQAILFTAAAHALVRTFSAGSALSVPLLPTRDSAWATKFGAEFVHVQ